MIGHCKAKKKKGARLLATVAVAQIHLLLPLPPLSAPPPPPRGPNYSSFESERGGERERDREAGLHHDNMRCPPMAGFGFLTAGLFTQPVESAPAPDDGRTRVVRAAFPCQRVMRQCCFAAVKSPPLRGSRQHPTLDILKLKLKGLI